MLDLMKAKDQVNDRTTGQSLPMAAPAGLGFSGPRIKGLLASLQADIDRNRLPGAVALIARHGQVALFESMGNQVPATAEQGPVPMARDSLFRIYSMTKPVVSVAVMMLVEQGKLLLSDPVGKHLPEFAHQQVMAATDGPASLVPVQHAATVQDLLRHTAGLTYEFLGNNPVQKLYTQARIRTDLRERSNAEFSAVLAPLPLIAEPATVWEYSRATDVLGRLVEVISGQTLRPWLQEHVFAPLGMRDTDFSVAPEHHHRIAEPFARDPDGAPQMRVFNVRAPAAFESGGGGLVSTAMDYARFLQFMMNRGELDGVRLLGPRTVDYMTADHLGTIPVNAGSSKTLLLPGYGFGLGFAVRTSRGIASEPGSVGLYYWGGLAGTTFFVDPAENMFAILMIQAPNQREHYRHLFRNMVYAALVD
jgi:CubicO group peptidase (beta-lactamase class C family)